MLGTWEGHLSSDDNNDSSEYLVPAWVHGIMSSGEYPRPLGQSGPSYGTAFQIRQLLGNQTTFFLIPSTNIEDVI